MKHLFIILLLFPTNLGETVRPSELEIRISRDNPGYWEWSHTKQEKTKWIYENRGYKEPVKID